MGVTFISFTENGEVLKKTYGTESTSEVKVYPMVCDRLTLTCDMPPWFKENYQEYWGQESDCKHSKKYYKTSCLIKDLPMKLSPYLSSEEDKITSAHIECNPYDSSNGFLRLDFNPAKIHIEDLRMRLDNNYLIQPGYDFEYVLKNGKITRIDFAVDIASEVAEGLYYYYSQMQRVEVIRSFSGQTEYVQGEVEYSGAKTEYLGTKIKPTKRVVIYDRLPAIKALNYKKFYTDLHEPEPKDDIMRVEVRLYNIKKTIKELPQLNNPFSPLVVSSLQADKYDDPLWKFFVALARFEGAQTSLARLPENMKKEYRERIRGGKVGWWKPDKIWMQLPSVINSITGA